MYRFLTSPTAYQRSQLGVLTSISRNDVQTTIIHMGGNVIVTGADSSYKWKIKAVEHARHRRQASGAAAAAAAAAGARYTGWDCSRRRAGSRPRQKLNQKKGPCISAGGPKKHLKHQQIDAFRGYKVPFFEYKLFKEDI